MSADNAQWSHSILRAVDPSFRHRWEVYKSSLESLLGAESVWIDCGCGENEMVSIYGHKVKTAAGVDAYIPEKLDAPSFIQADARSLPLADGSVDIVSLRFVVEHFEDVPRSMAEIARVVKPGGRVLILTTNKLSPLILLPRLLPYSLKNRLISRLFKVSSADIFPTHHRLNTPAAFRKLAPGFVVEEMRFLSDLNYSRRWLFIILLLLHLASFLPLLKKFRSNILVVLRRS